MATAVTIAKRNGWLNGFAVFWHVWPYRTVIDREVRQIGFELELIGSHCMDLGHLNPGCPQCRRIRSALIAVAEHLTNDVFPNIQESLTYEIDSHATSIVCSANRPCATVSIIVMHRHAFDRAIDGSDNLVLGSIKRSMAELGIPER